MSAEDVDSNATTDLRDPVAEQAAAQHDVTMTASGSRPRAASPATPDHPESVHLTKVGHLGDTIFRGSAWTAAIILVALVAFVGIFLLVTAIPSLMQNQENFLTSTRWDIGNPATGGTLAFGIAALLWTTVLSSIVAMVVAVPIAVGTALLITQYLRPKVGSTIGFLVDLLAAVPSIVFGLWGAKLFGPSLAPLYSWIRDTFGWIPLFGPGVDSTSNVLTASLVLAIMILPIITAVSRDVFAQTPRDHIEAALALGATKWEMIRTAVIPYGRSGVVAASMLGLGRALGETVAVMIILSQVNDTSINVSLFAGGETFASKIANNAAEFDSPAKTGAYIAAGLVLFLVTFAVNAAARIVVDRRRVT